MSEFLKTQNKGSIFPGFVSQVDILPKFVNLVDGVYKSPKWFETLKFSQIAATNKMRYIQMESLHT